MRRGVHFESRAECEMAARCTGMHQHLISGILGGPCVRLFGDGRAFVKQVSDSVVQRTGAPSLDAAHFSLEFSIQSVLNRQQFSKMCPRQL